MTALPETPPTDDDLVGVPPLDGEDLHPDQRQQLVLVLRTRRSLPSFDDDAQFDTGCRRHHAHLGDQQFFDSLPAPPRRTRTPRQRACRPRSCRRPVGVLAEDLVLRAAVEQGQLGEPFDDVVERGASATPTLETIAEAKAAPCRPARGSAFASSALPRRVAAALAGTTSRCAG
jgi:hypothetical protein